MPLQYEKRKLLSFSPDLDHLTEGILLDGNGFVPTMKGLRTLPVPQLLGPTLSDICLGAAAFQFDNGAAYLIAGTTNTLNIYDLGTFPALLNTQILPTISTTDRWRFAIYQGIICAVSGNNPPLVTDLASINAPTFQLAVPWTFLTGGPPNSSIVAASDFSLFLIQFSSATWWSSFNPTIWTPAIETETVTSTLTQTSGFITAAKALRSNMVIYKATSMFLGSQTGPPFFWTFGNISKQIGTPSQEAVVSVKDVHYFLGTDDFYTFDGFSVNPIPNALREWFFDRVGEALLPMVCARYDQARSLVFWHFQTNAAAEVGINEWICLNTRTGQWTNGSEFIDICVDGSFIFALNETASGFVRSVDHGVWVYGNNTNIPTGAIDAFVTTGDLGDRRFMYQLTRVRPGYSIQRGTPTITPLNSYSPGSPYVPGTTVPLSADKWFNMNNTARLQRLRFNANRDMEMSDYELQFSQAGDS